MATPPAITSGSDRMRPTSAAARARSSKPGPRATEGTPTIVPRSGLISTAVTVESAPAITHTTVETRLVEMPASSAPSGLAAAARMAMPYELRFRNSDRPTTIAGTKAITMRCSLCRKRLPMRTVTLNGVGYCATWLIPGSTAWAKNNTWATPMVATTSASRDALAKRRTTRRSTAAPISPPTAVTTARATKKFQCRSRTTLPRRAAPKAPISP